MVLQIKNALRTLKASFGLENKNMKPSKKKWRSYKKKKCKGATERKTDRMKEAKTDWKKEI